MGLRNCLCNFKARVSDLELLLQKIEKNFRMISLRLAFIFFFDTIITVENSFAPKQSPEPMLANLNKAWVKSCEVLYI